jgi:ParB family transcriptional regulator, chromosome partitioning protein
MFEEEQYLDLKEIDLIDSTYRISTDNDISVLSGSIQANGLINPVIVVKKRENYIVVSGYKRVLAVKETLADKIFVKIVKKKSKEKTHYNCSKLAVIENAFVRELNHIELANALSLLSQSLSVKEINLNSSFFFKKRLNEKIINKLIKIHSMNESVHALILSKKLSIDNAIKLNEFKPEIFDAFINVFKKIRMGQNKQKEIIVYFHEVALRDQRSLFDLITSNAVHKIINHDNPDENFKANLLRLFINQLRFPELTEAYKSLRDGIKELKLEPEIKLIPPENFEGDDYSLSFKFKSISDFNKKIEKILSVYKSTAFEKIIK